MHKNLTSHSDYAILFLHGNSLSSKIYTNLNPEGAFRDCDLIFKDLPGHGKAERVNNYNISKLEEFLIAVIKEIKAPRLIIVAHSFSGHLCLQSLHKLISIKKIVGVITIGTPLIENPKEIGLYFNLKNSSCLFSNQNKEASIRMLNELFLPLSREKIKSFFEQTDPLFRETMEKPDYFINYKNEVEIVRKAQIPITLIYGADDPFLNMSYIQGMSLPQNCRMQIINDAGHLPFLSNPDCITKEISKLINDDY